MAKITFCYFKHYDWNVGYILPNQTGHTDFVVSNRLSKYLTFLDTCSICQKLAEFLGKKYI